MSSVNAEWPDIPVPLIDRGHSRLSRSTVTLFETGRRRVRRSHYAPVHLIEATWHFTEDEFETFKAFFETDLQHGSLPFEMTTFDPSPTVGMLTQMWWLLAFLESGYSFNHTNGLFVVTSTLEVVDENSVEINDPNYQDPSLEVSYDDPTVSGPCRHTIYAKCPVVEGQTYQLEISHDKDGPFTEFIKFTALVTETKYVAINNDFDQENEGDIWLRLRRGNSGVRGSTKILPPTIRPPQMNISHLAEATDYDTSLALPQAGEWLLPYSSAENGLIAPDDLYIVPRKRLVLWGPDNATVGTSFADQIVEVIGESGAIHKWTRDGNDPTLDTIIRRYEGFDDNLAAHRGDFRFIIKCRSFKGGCKSPMTCYLVDRRLYQLTWFESRGYSSSLISIPCDKPKTYGDETYESGQSCNLVWGGVDGPRNFLRSLFANQTFASDVDDTGYGTNGTDPDTGNPYRGLYSHTVGVQESVDWLGWTVVQTSGSMYYHKSMNFFRSSVLTDIASPCYCNVYTEWKREWQDGPYDSGSDTQTYFSSAGLSIVNGPYGSNAPLESIITEIFNYDNINIWAKYGFVWLTRLDLYFTLLDDFHSRFDSDYDEYVPAFPVIAVPEEEPPPEVYYDDFEEYANEDDLAGSGISYNAGTGWNAAWVFFAETASFGFDDFESYEVQGDLAGLVDPLEDGEGWKEGESWIFDDLPVGEDDFQAYTAEAITYLSASFNQGAGWVEDESWIITDLEDRFGDDAFTAYDVGDITGGVLDIDGGTGWIVSTPWQIRDNDYGDDDFSSYTTGDWTDEEAGILWAAGEPWSILGILDASLLVVSADTTIPPSTITMSVTGYPGASVYYTTDGSTPSSASTLYSAPFVQSTDALVRAVAYVPGFSGIHASLTIASLTTPSNRWSFEEASGTPVDSIGGRATTLVGTPTYSQPGKVGNAIRFTTSSAINMGAGFLNSTTGWSMCVWFKLASGSGGGYRGFLCQSTTHGLFINGGRLEPYNWAGGGQVGPDLRDDNWHHLCITNIVGAVKFYLDGVLVKSSTSQSNATQMGFAYNGGGGEFLDAVADELEFFHGTILVEDEIEARAAM